MKILTTLLFILLASCKPILKLYYGYHAPKPEDKESITKYLKKKNIRADNVLVFKDSISCKKKYKTDLTDPKRRINDEKNYFA